jgi:hypothetical protein
MKKMKKMFKGVLATTLVCGGLVLGVGAETSHAGANRLIDIATIGNGTTGYLDGSTGGYAKICLREAFGGANVAIYDNDGGNNPLIRKSTFMNNNSCYTFNAAPYVDGTDKNAEFIVVTSRDIIGTIKFELWD